MEKMSKVQADAMYWFRYMQLWAKRVVDRTQECSGGIKRMSDGVFAVHFSYTRTMKALQRKGYIKSIKFATAPDRRHYITIVKIS